MILMIDNYDSFVYNLVQYVSDLGESIVVKRNNEITIDGIRDLAPDKIIISPGPSTPDEAGVSIDIIQQFKETIPILGVCLGHQAIIQAFGGKVIHANQVMHGKISTITHNACGLFSGIPSPFRVTRYHSLVGEFNSLPNCLEISAQLEDDPESIMAVSHKQYKVFGVQFHPESIMSEYGHKLLSNFINN